MGSKWRTVDNMCGLDIVYLGAFENVARYLLSIERDGLNPPWGYLAVPCSRMLIEPNDKSFQ